MDRFTVYCTVRKQKDADMLTKESGGKVKPLLMDVTKDQDMQAVKETLENAGVPFVGLVNNAGVAKTATIEYANMDDVRWVFDVNVFGVIRMTQLLLPALRASKGRVVTVGSLAGKFGELTVTPYSCSKFAMEGFTDGLRRELLPYDVSVSLLEPGYTKTEILSAFTFDDVSDQEKAAYPYLYSKAKEEERNKIFAKASPMNEATDAIVHSLTSPYPKTRYPVANLLGIPGWVLARLMWLMPDRMLDIDVLAIVNMIPL